MTLFQSILIALVEGLTEFLPISSTGHMILASTAMGIHEDEFVKTFEVFIQLGAILAIALMYIKRFFRSLTIYFKLITAFLPTAVVGLLAYDYIKAYLFNPVVVSVSLISQTTLYNISPVSKPLSICIMVIPVSLSPISTAR